MGLRTWFNRTLGGAHDERVVAGEYELRVHVLHAGTRSEGRIGRLYRRGVEVEGANVGHVVDAGSQQFVFRGDNRPHIWSVSGWAPVNKSAAGSID
ncbi:MAG: hypothetical protein K8R99_05365 [Actinomycetia bacterium]|nr:hypothetical protein [Actinomycetes bacterium]